MSTDTLAQNRIDEWLTPTFDAQVHETIEKMKKDAPAELEDSFYRDLEFGTGGMRGVMGVGTNRINSYTLGKSTQGLSNYLKKTFPGEAVKAVIAYDCRHNSDTLARTVANVLSANGVEVFLFSSLRPTPELSFAVRHLGCHCGIVLTASHNPPEYNGYKVYWQDGGQLVPPEDGEIISEINSLNYADIQFTPKEDLIHMIDTEVDSVFIEESVKNGCDAMLSEVDRNSVSVVFTPLHGTSVTMVPPVLEKAGYTHVHIVEAQAEPDGDFPTVKSPNPEETEALEMALQLAEKKNADIVIGTDPDCDRLGIAVRDTKGDLKLLNGNQTMIVMTWFLLENYKKDIGFEGNEFVASTIVSTPMLRKMAAAYGVEYKEVLTGFKWIAKLIKDFPNQKFIGGGEESFGYMVGDFVRDKDAVTSTLLACEIVTKLKSERSSFYQKLLELYVDYGVYHEKLVSLVKKGQNGAAEIKQMMVDLRNNAPTSINGSNVVTIEDYQNSTRRNMADGTTEILDIPKSNVLIFYTEDGSKIAARPSGTEPKIKFYVSVQSPLDRTDNYPKVLQQLQDKIDGILKDLDI